MNELVNESKAIQERLPSTNSQMNIEKFSSKFKQLMQKSNGALRLLTNNMGIGILPLSKETLPMLCLKHPEVEQAHHKAILQGPKRQIHSTVYEDTNEDLVKKAAIKAKGGCGPSELDADN